MDAALSFARNVASLAFEDIPGEVVDVTKKSILDTLGVMVAGSTTEEACRGLVGLVREGGGKKESTIVGFGGKVPSWMAAFANGSMCHVLDYDDTHDEAVVHPTASTLPAALALAERVGRVNGKKLITAVALGNDMACRIALALKKSILEYGWLPPTVYGALSATVASGKMLGLNEEQMVSAFGIAIHQAAGSKEALYDTGSVIRAIRDAFSGKTGVLSALMAQIGIQGVQNSLEGKAGLFNLYFKGEYDPVRLTAGLGKRFEGTGVSFKPWPACRICHPYIGATLALVQEHDIRPEDIKELKVVVGHAGQTLCEPLEERRKPQLSIQAKFSIPFAVAVAASRRKVVIGDFLEEGLKSSQVLQIAEKVTYTVDHSLGEGILVPGTVEVKTGDGRLYSKRQEVPYGHPKNPLSMEDLIAKFRDCCQYSARPLSKDRVERLIELVTGLERVEDVGQIIRLLG